MPKKVQKETLNGKRLNELKEMLLNEKALVLKHSARELGCEGGVAHGDMADLTTEIAEREQLLRLAEHDRERLRLIDEALEMVDNGQYGTCNECGVAIPEPRLKALPTASLCVTCQATVERRG